jgi:hypothetical protein
MDKYIIMPQITWTREMGQSESGRIDPIIIYIVLLRFDCKRLDLKKVIF